MLKHYNIISQLSDGDKIRLLSDMNSLSDKQYRVLGIPPVRIGAAKDFCSDRYPSPQALANTWDTQLVGRVADGVFKKMGEQDVGLVTVPGPKIKVNPYRAAISEDPYLASAMSREYLLAAGRIGTSVGIDGFAISYDEPEWLDGCVSERFINESVIKPYRDALRDVECAAVLTEPDLTAKGLEEVNSDLASRAVRDRIAGDAVAVCRRVPMEKTVSHIVGGGLCFEGSAVALESALSRYKQLKKAIEHGTTTVEDLNLEISRGKAISPELLDTAVDRLLDFAFSVKRRPMILGNESDDPCAIAASRESVVLLKNENTILPMKRAAKVCILGDPKLFGGAENENAIETCAAQLTARGYSYIGAQPGYDLKRDRSEELIEDAITLAEQADVVLVFLGLGEEREKRTVKSKRVSIPANQQELLDRLVNNSKKVVVIVPPEHTPDVGIAENCAAILLAPLHTTFSITALVEVLSGEVNPSGKLASTVYLNTEDRYIEYKTHKERDGIKTGPFIGYRYYDTVGQYPIFPFGHGLSYTSFSYSQLSLRDNTVRFTVKNEGKKAGATVAQLYVGMEQSSILRPKKELCGFARISLEAGEKKLVEIPLCLPSVYDAESGGLVNEQGSYVLYVGESVQDVRLTHRILSGDKKLAEDGERLSDYLQSESNIITDNFKLEAKINTMKKSVFNFIAGAVALALAVLLKMYCVYSALDAAFFDLFVAALGVAGLVFFVVEAVRRNRLRSEERARVDQANAEMFEDAEDVTVYGAERMFVKEFDLSEQEAMSAAEEHADTIDAEYLAYIDKEQNFASATREFEIFAAERGCKFSSDTVRKIFASIASSRLMVVSGMDNKAFKDMMLLLGEYFETSAYIDHTDVSYTGADSLLFKTDENGNRVKTSALSAIEAARNTAHSVHFASLTNVRCAELPTYFSAYVNYVKSPMGHHHVTVLNDQNAESSYYIPQNLWFVLNLADGETPDKLPDFISEVATVNQLRFETCQSSAKHTQVRKFSYYQLDHLSERVASSFFVEEDSWKKVDRLEEYVGEHTDFHIGNKLWLCMERFASVYIACGGEKQAALDEAVSAKLISLVIAELRGKLGNGEKSLSETVETVFGENCADACERLIRLCGTEQ